MKVVITNKRLGRIILGSIFGFFMITPFFPVINGKQPLFYNTSERPCCQDISDEECAIRMSAWHAKVGEHPTDSEYNDHIWRIINLVVFGGIVLVLFIWFMVALFDNQIRFTKEFHI